jgi:CubicO group peptidase (beta-lactamase class C family)
MKKSGGSHSSLKLTRTIPLRNTMQHIEQKIQSHIDSGAFVGLSLAMIQNGAVTYSRGFGVTSVEEGGVPLSANTLFNIGSITKVLTGALIMRLVEQGRLDLDSPVIAYIPEFRFSDDDWGSRVTLRHLLSHTSGLPPAGKDWGPRNADALERYVWDELSKHSFLAAPGRIHTYSNTALVMAGYLAEVVTGQAFDEVLQEIVLEPLGMAHTTFDHTVAMTYPLALPHAMSDDGRVSVTHRFVDNLSGHPSGFSFSNTSDLTKLALMFLNNGVSDQKAFLSPASIRTMHSAIASQHMMGAGHPFAHISREYGITFMLGEYKGHRIARHGGMSQSFNNFFELFPEQRSGVIVLTNFADDAALIELIVTLYDEVLGLPHEGIVYHKPVALPVTDSISHYWPRYEGHYLNPSYGSSIVEIRGQGGQLTLVRAEDILPLQPLGDHQYFGQIEESRIPIAFLLEEDGSVQHISISGTPYSRIELDSQFVPSPDQWLAYVGTHEDFKDPAGLQLLHINIADGQLTAALWGDISSCRPLSNTCFLSGHGLIEFTMEEGTPVAIVGRAAHYRRISTRDRK